jgi:hypothetical protein
MTLQLRRLRLGSTMAAACFAVLSIMRGLDGDIVWASVFAVATLGYVWLGLRGPDRPTTAEQGAPRQSPGVAASTSHSRVASRRSRAPRRSPRTWALLTASAATLTAALALWSEPALALLGAVTAAAACLGWWRSRTSRP